MVKLGEKIGSPTPDTSKGGRTNPGRFELKQFFPYRMAVLAERISEAVSQVYSGRFDLSRSDWRVLAALGVNRQMAAKKLAPYSTLDKMQVSRAVGRLEARGLVCREEDTADHRTQILRLTDAGRALYQKLVPLVLAREAYILDVLDADELAMLERILLKIQSRAGELIERG